MIITITYLSLQFWKEGYACGEINTQTICHFNVDKGGFAGAWSQLARLSSTSNLRRAYFCDRIITQKICHFNFALVDTKKYPKRMGAGQMCEDTHYLILHLVVEILEFKQASSHVGLWQAFRIFAGHTRLKLCEQMSSLDMTVIYGIWVSLSKQDVTKNVTGNTRTFLQVSPRRISRME